MGLFKKNKGGAASASTAAIDPALLAPPPETPEPQAGPVEVLSFSLSQLGKAVSAVDGQTRLRQAPTMLVLLGRVALQLSDVGSAAHEQCVAVLRQTQGVESITTVLQDASITTTAAALKPEQRVALQQAALSCLASVAYIGGVSDLQQRSDVVLLVQLMASEHATVRSFAAACMQNLTVFVEQLDLELLEPQLPALRQLGEHQDEDISGPTQMVLANVERAQAIASGDTSVAPAMTVTTAPRSATAPGGGAWWKTNNAVAAVQAFQDAAQKSRRSSSAAATGQRSAGPSSSSSAAAAAAAAAPEDEGDGETIEKMLEMKLRCGGGGFGLVLATGDQGEVLVEEVDAAGPNAASGVRAADELVSVGGKAVRRDYDAAIDGLRAAAAAAGAARDEASAPTLHVLGIKATKLGDALGEGASDRKLYVRVVLAEAGGGLAEVGAGGGVSARTDVCKDVGKGAWDDKLKLRVPPGCPKEPLLLQIALLDKDDASGEAAPLAQTELKLAAGDGGGGANGGASLKGKEKLVLTLAAPPPPEGGGDDASAGGGKRAEVRLALSWQLDTPAVPAVLEAEELPCAVARRVAAPSPWDALGGMIARMDAQVLRLVDPYAAVRTATAANTIQRAAKAWGEHAREKIAEKRLQRTRGEDLAAAASAAEAASAARTHSTTLRGAVDATAMAQRLAAAGIHSATPVEGGGGNQLQMRRADFERLMSSGGLESLLASKPASNPSTLSGHYYAQRYDDHAYSRTGPSLTALADAATLKQRMQTAPISDGTFARFSEQALTRKVRIVKDGKPIQLTGRQVEALSVAAARNPARQIAFDHGGTRVVLTTKQIASLRDAVEAETLPEEEDNWFFSKDGTSGTQQGPVGTGELQRKYASGELTDAAIAWNPKMPEWKQIGELAELQTAHPRNTVGRRAHRVAPMEPEQVDLGS